MMVSLHCGYLENSICSADKIWQDGAISPPTKQGLGAYLRLRKPTNVIHHLYFLQDLCAFQTNYCQIDMWINVLSEQIFQWETCIVAYSLTKWNVLHCGEAFATLGTGRTLAWSDNWRLCTWDLHTVWYNLCMGSGVKLGTDFCPNLSGDFYTIICGHGLYNFQMKYMMAQVTVASSVAGYGSQLDHMQLHWEHLTLVNFP